MLILDQLRRSDRPLQCLAATILTGMVVLLCGLWYVQVIAAQRFRTDLQAQSFRTVRMPAIRGKILDRNHVPLAENRPAYNVNLYLEELRPYFKAEYTERVKREFLARHSSPTNLTALVREELQKVARYRVASNLLAEISAALQQPQVLSERAFHRHYDEQRSLPYPLLRDLAPEQVAVFVERSAHWPGMELDIQPIRVYPQRTLAAHLLGHLKRDDQPGDADDIAFKFHLPDYTGIRGIEAAFDVELRGQAGLKSVLVNSMAYRQAEEMAIDPVPGQNLILTIDLAIQQAAERGLARLGWETRAAAVVMDVETGDILALASAPAFDPNKFVTGLTHAELAELNDETLAPMFNRATYGQFPAGSTFKIVVGLAGLESGILLPDAIYVSAGEFKLGGRGRPIRDTAGPGDFDFEKAFYRSSNPYFIEYGLRVGPEKLIEMGRRFGLGEPTGLATRQEAKGFFPTISPLRRADGGSWTAGDTANLSIGHGEILVTPLQMAVLTAAVANGGKLLKPRLVQALEPQHEAGAEARVVFPSGIIRREISVSHRSLQLVRQAMLADVEHSAGTGRSAAVPGFRVAGKTGTAKLQNDNVTWFVAFAPYERPRYACAVVVQEGKSGGSTCAPVAREIFQTVAQRERVAAAPSPSLASVP